MLNTPKSVSGSGSQFGVSDAVVWRLVTWSQNGAGRTRRGADRNEVAAYRSGRAVHDLTWITFRVRVVGFLPSLEKWKARQGRPRGPRPLISFLGLKNIRD